MTEYIKRILFNYKVRALALGVSSILIFLSLITYSQSDPALNLVTDKEPANLLQAFGSYLSDLLYQFFGISIFIVPICFLSWSARLFERGEISWLPFKIVLMCLSLVSGSLALASTSLAGALPAGLSGAVGILLQPIVKDFGLMASMIAAGIAIASFILAVGISLEGYRAFAGYLAKVGKIIGKIKPPIPSLPTLSSSHKISPLISGKTAPVFEGSQENYTRQAPSPSQATSFSAPPASIKVQVPEGAAALPTTELLKQPNNQNVKAESASELKQNGERLLRVLEEFGVKGEVIDIAQGPVVTLYEFEPAAGTKSSRVIGLADDIARSLSALSTRIAVVPGRNVLGIELPNKHRAFFCLKELIETPEYKDQNLMLPIILGKDLSGKPCVADLTKMPHLLVAGTTGSGKSVAINTMIMSLLYRYTPEECRLIMIDPKMLELSAYDGIPHLLTPVVTEPAKAVVALKWAVKEMENRYRLMSTLSVRNIAGYNAKILEASKAGKHLERTVQTGFDPETGKPIYESIPIDMEKLPYIVVIVDEMADLMLVAGKDIESSVQRLAQMARAAGIHIIMATQRPSVDVITGVIKANFPSRVSFRVTSKIDSRTILGEQGAEALLGMGDMLYMGNTSRIIRAHGPFVDDSEVEAVTQYLRTTGTPDYISAVTEAAEEDEELPDVFGDEGDDESLYKQAVQIVRTEGKVSISYIQRRLKIGYNRSANIVDRMEREGVVTPADNTGKRTVIKQE